MQLTVRLSRNNCMMRVLSLYESSFSVSNSAIASSNAYNKIKFKLQLFNIYHKMIFLNQIFQFVKNIFTKKKINKPDRTNFKHNVL